MGSEGYLINQFIAPRTNHRDDEWGGSFDNRIRFPGRDRAPHARGSRAAISSSSIACRCSTWSRAAAPGTRSWRSRKAIESRGRDDHQHRHRLARGAHPDHRHHGAARGVRLGDAAAEGRGVDSADHDQPHQRSRRRRGRCSRAATPTWCRWRGRSSPMRSSSTRQRRVAPTRSTPASRCNQACLDQIFERKIASCLVNPRACHETELVVDAGGRAKTRRRRRRRPGRPRVRDDRRRARPRGHAVRRRGGDRRPVQSRASAFRARRSSRETLRYFRTRLDALGVDARAQRAASTPADLARLRRRDARHRHRAAHAGDPRHRPPEGGELRRHRRRAPQGAGARVAIVGAGGIGFDVARIPDAQSRAAPSDRHRDRWIRDEWGIDVDVRAVAAASHRRRPSRPPREVWLLQRKASKVGARPRQDDGLDPPRRCCKTPRRHDDRRRRRTSASTMPACTSSVDGERAAARGRHDRDLRRPGAAARARRPLRRRRHRRSR